jgi:mRNA interferase MazF
MVKQSYIPERGDLIWLDFTPQTGHEQAGLRPALVISPRSYNRISGLCVLFPVTRQIKGYPFEVLLQTTQVKGAILADQIKNLDWRVRNAQYIETAGEEVINEVINLFSTLLL